MALPGLACVATTGAAHTGERGTKSAQDEGLRQGMINNYFRSAVWTADGTSIVTNSADNKIRTWVVPPALLEDRDDPLVLTPYSTISAAEPLTAVATYPLFTLQEPSACLVLSSMRDHPIRLDSALASHTVGTYPLVNPTTEAYISPHSLLFSKAGTRFTAGTDSLVSVFDLSTPGKRPLSSIATDVRKSRGVASSGMSMRGIVSALAVDESSGILAAGTFTRNVGLYAAEGQGECFGVFHVHGTNADELIGGSGITQLIWSPCGRYLYIAERKSDGVLLYDIRKTGQLLGWLQGRNAMTNQRLGVDLMSGQDGGYEIWAGGVDGKIRMWHNAHQTDGVQNPDWEQIAHASAVCAAVAHPSGLVIASASGSRHWEGNDHFANGSDNTLKLWHSTSHNQGDAT